MSYCDIINVSLINFNFIKNKKIIGVFTINKLPLYNALIAHQKLERSSFHTPGHKNHGIIKQNLLSLDLTELPDTDALFEADGVILECEKNLAKLFGTKRTLISAGGCSLAIMTMIRLATQDGGKLICGRNIHRSAVNAMSLLGIEPIWILPKDGGYFTGRIDANDVRNALDSNPDACGCYITSPTYYGEISDIKAISEVCHEYDVPLLVDNAHGSHIKFISEDIHPITLGASMTACSLHKTLPVLTGGAVLNINDSRFVAGAKEAMSLFASTSPSYPIMASIDLCADYLLNGGINEYKRFESLISDIKRTADLCAIIQPNGLCDPLRVSINTSSIGISGERAGEYFRSRGLEPEFADRENVVFICTPFNTSEDLYRLKSEICLIETLDKDFTKEFSHYISLPQKAMSLRDAVFAKSEFVSKEDSIGRIAADTACPCPPGIPVYMPGEIISRNDFLGDVVKVVLE